MCIFHYHNWMVTACRRNASHIKDCWSSNQSQFQFESWLSGAFYQIEFQHENLHCVNGFFWHFRTYSSKFLWHTTFFLENPVTFPYWLQAMADEEMNAMKIQIMEGCKAQESPSDKDFLLLMSHKEPKGRGGRCMLACILESIGVVCSNQYFDILIEAVQLFYISIISDSGWKSFFGR